MKSICIFLNVVKFSLKLSLDWNVMDIYDTFREVISVDQYRKTANIQM